MIDPNVTVRKWLATGLSTTRVSVAVLPAYDDKNSTGFRPEDGPWIVVGVAGGGMLSELPIFDGQIQITVFAGVDEGAAAGALSVQVRGLLHDKNHIDLSPDGYILSSSESNGDQPGAEQIAGLATSISLYDMKIR